jgi:uncharacterized membrane protein YphA (DoxX/SURF4 family)
MNKRLSTKEIEKKAAIETTILMLKVIGALTLVVGICYIFPFITAYVAYGFVILLFLFFIWFMIYIGVEQDIRHKEWDNWRRS